MIEKRELSQLKSEADIICKKMDFMVSLTDAELKAKTAEFKSRLKNGEKLDGILPDAYAAVGEAARRTLGLKPYPVQMMGAIGLHRGRVVEQATGEGKAVTLDTLIPTPSGWNLAGDIQVGDMVFGRDGRPTRVVGVYPQGKKPIYRVTLADGRVVETADEHLWSVYKTGSSKLSTLTTAEIMKSGLKSGKTYKYRLPVADAVMYPEKDLPIAPYLYGFQLYELGEKGVQLSEEYALASIEQRYAVIQGAFDTYGRLHQKQLRYETPFESVANFVREIIFSLGFSCDKKKINKNYVIVVHVSNDLKQKFFKNNLNRIWEAKDIADCDSRTYDKVAIVDIEKTTEAAEMVCFTVDNDEHLFLCGDYVVTHNTLVAAMPAYLNALEGKGVHVVTVNDYLAERDAKEIGKIHEFMGLSVGCVLKDTSSVKKKEEYAKDITYITNTELGFDYLRDNMAQRPEDRMQRGYHYCIIDEVDSVLIDEARTPLIISGMSGKSNKMYVACNELVQILERGEAGDELSKAAILSGERPIETGDYVVDEEHHIVNLTLQGIQKCEEYFGIDNLSDRQNTELMHNIIAALKAHTLMKKDKDYVVKDGEVMIVDAFTGRIQPGRRYSDGIHQAIEAKEHVDINDETSTFATVTYQNFFNKYDKKCGMTGTAYTERKEFKEIYHMDVVRIPTNKPRIRTDAHDRMFLDKTSKFQAVVNEVKLAHEKGQPVLVGTSTIRDSEILDKMMTQEKLPHTVLNAKFLEKEADIIAKAGTYGSITIATNMAGRGTDIKLDEKAKEAGGLKVIGTQRHESRRIDNQLKGRSGRQGDPGESIFFLSLDDEVLRLYGSDRMKAALQATGLKEDENLANATVNRFVKKAQTVIEDNNFGARKSVLKFDKVNNEQRELIYAERNAILDKADTRDTMLGMIEDSINMIVDKHSKKNCITYDEYNEMKKELEILVHDIAVPLFREGITKKYIADECIKSAMIMYCKREQEWPDISVFRDFERQILLKCIDDKWMQHINDLEILRQNISLVGYGQKDPTVVYKLKAFDMFTKMSDDIKNDAVYMLFSSRLKAE